MVYAQTRRFWDNLKSDYSVIFFALHNAGIIWGQQPAFCVCFVESKNICIELETVTIRRFCDEQMESAAHMHGTHAGLVHFKRKHLDVYQALAGSYTSWHRP